MTLYEALGAQRERVPFEVLAKGAKEKDVHGLIRMGALRGMGSSRRDEALPFLLEASVYGAPTERTRSGAAAGLGRLAPVLGRGPREKAVDRLRDMLRDPQDFVRWSAGVGLRQAEAPEAIGDLEGLRKMVPLQQQVVVERLVAALAKGAEPKVAALEKQLEEITDKWRKLDVRLQSIEHKDKPAVKVAVKAAVKAATRAAKKKKK
jgi:HEAT repeat protein